MFTHSCQTSFNFIAYALMITTLAVSSSGQDEDVETIQRQIRQLQERVNDLQSNDDPFGKRVRSVGRQRVAKPEPVDDELTIRFYDLSDVFSVAPQYPAQTATDFSNTTPHVFPIASYRGSRSLSGGGFGGGGFGGGGGGVFNVPPTQQQPQPTSIQAARVSVNSLVDAVKQTVAPDDWDDTSGDASVSILGNTLLISATESMHEQIANLLDLFREHWGKLKTVSIQAFWIEADPAQISELLDNDQPNPVVGRVEDRKWRSFFDKASQNNRVAYAASMCGQNGQTLHTVSGRQHYVVVDADPIYAFDGFRDRIDEELTDQIEQSVAGMKPVRQMFQDGAAIQCSPLATRGGNFVILDVHTRVNQRIEPDQGDPANTIKVVAADRSGKELAIELDNRPYVSYRLSTTVRCPRNEIVLAGGMTYDSNVESERPNLYLFIKTGIHTIEEDKSDRTLE